MTNCYWAPNLYVAGTGRYPKGGRLIEVQLYYQTDHDKTW